MYSVINRKRMIISTIVFFFIITNPIIAVILDINLGNDIANKNLLKLSNSDIAIITPENKTYIESMSGYYPATFGFENDEEGGDPGGWIIDESGGTVNILSELDGHKKVLELNDTNTNRVEGINNFSAVEHGTIECWIRSTDVNKRTFIELRSGSIEAIYLIIREYDWKYWGSSGIISIEKASGGSMDTPLANIWYHIKIEFECGTSNYAGLEEDHWRVYINGIMSVNLDFFDGNALNSINSTSFRTHSTLDNYISYYDALGYSWDPAYEVGDNTKEGLLLSFEYSIDFDWLGYSLDGNNNLTILGNTTLPMPLQGLHSIQVFGNDTSGTIYSSDLRYFTIKYPNLKVTLEVPASCELNTTYTINATVINNGGRNETSVNLILFLDNIIVNSTFIFDLPIEAKKSIAYQWTPSEYDIYNFTAYTFPIPGEFDMEDNIKTELIRISNSVLFNGMRINYQIPYNDAATKLTYTYLSGNTFHAKWDWPAFFTYSFWWDVDTKTRIITNNGGNHPLLPFILADGTHDFAWIFTDVELNDTIPITGILSLDHYFKITDELIYELPSFGPVGVWVLQDVDNPNAIAWYEKSTGILLNASVYSDVYEELYNIRFISTNAVFTNAILPGPFVLSSNAGIPDNDGIFNLTWTTASDADYYSIYRYSSYISEINDSVTLLAEKISDLTFPVSGLTDGTYYYIVEAHNMFGDTLSNCISVDVVLPLMLNIIIPDNSCSWEVDSPQNISWNSTGAISDVKLELYKEDVLVMEIVSETSNDGFYSWNIPSILEGSTHYQIKISDVSNSSIYNYSEYFEIYIPIIDSLTVTTPDSLTIWETGTSQDITWTSTGTISNVKIELYENDEFVMDIMTSTTNDGSYTWVISPDLEEGIDYQIKISDVSDPTNYDFSDYFEIKKPTSEGLTDIPGYDLYLLISIIFIISVILFRNKFKKLK